MTGRHRRPVPPDVTRAALVAGQACDIADLTAALLSLDTAWRELIDPVTGDFRPLARPYVEWLPTYRGIVADTIDTWPQPEDRWHTVADAMRARGRLDTALRRLLDEGYVSPGLIRSYGITEDDLMTLGQYDYRAACKRGVYVDCADWRKPIDAWPDSPYVAGLLDAWQAAERELVALVNAGRAPMRLPATDIPTVTPWDPWADLARLELAA